MTSRELANKLLEIGNMSIAFKSGEHEADFVENIKIVQLNDPDDIMNPTNSVYLIGARETNK